MPLSLKHAFWILLPLVFLFAPSIQGNAEGLIYSSNIDYHFAYHLKRFLVKYFNFSCAPNWKLYQEMNNTHWDKEVIIKLTLVSIVETTNGAENIASTIIQHTITVKIYNMLCSHLNVKCLFLPYIFIIMPRSI